MQRVEMFRTFDGETHQTINRATSHLDKLYGEKLCAMARLLIAGDGKYSATLEILDANVHKFAEILRIKADFNIESEE